MRRLTTLIILLMLPLTGCDSGSAAPEPGDAISAEDTPQAEAQEDASSSPEASPEGAGDTVDEASSDAGPAPGDDASQETPDTPALPLSDPGELGPFAFDVSTHTETFTIEGGSEDMLIVIYMPEGEGPFPLVTFTHGFQLAPADYVSYGEQLASWGYIALLPQMPGGLFGGPTHVDLKHYLSALLDWAEADESVLESKVDPARIGLAGHSMGGKISLLLASDDTRPLAVFGVDPVDAAGGPMPVDDADFPSVTPERMGDISIPLALLGETTNGSGEGSVLGQSCAPSEDNFQAYFAHAVSPAIEIDVLGASHMSFLDNPDCGLACLVCPTGSDDPATSRMLAQRYMIAFFNSVIKGDEAYTDYLTGDAMNADIAAGLVAIQTKNGF